MTRVPTVVSDLCGNQSVSRVPLIILHVLGDGAAVMLNRVVEDPRHRAGACSLETPRAAHGDDPRRDSTDRVRLAAITSRMKYERIWLLPHS